MIDQDEEQLVATAEGSAAPELSAPHVVVVGDHSVVLHPAVTIPLGIAALSVFRQGGSQATIEASLAEVYLRYGIASWTFLDPVTPENVERLLPFADGGLEVAEAADRLYSNEVLRPLRRRYPTLFEPTPTAPPISAISPTGSMPPKLSGRSSPNGTHGKRSGAKAR